MNCKGISNNRLIKFLNGIHSNFLLGLAIIISFTVNPISFAQTNSSPMNFGMNFIYLSNWDREMPFVDLMKTSSLWNTQNSVFVANGKNLFNTGVRDSIPADADGYPLQLPYNVAGTEAPQIVLSQMMTAQSGLYPAGDYVCLYDGSGTLTFSGDVAVVSQTPGRIILKITPSNNGLQMKITQSTLGNHVRNIRILMPGTEQTYQTQPFNSAFLNKIEPFKVLRFMWWQFVTDGIETTWSNRKLPTYYTQASYFSSTKKSFSCAYEYITQLCNQTNKDAWVCVPHTADSSFVRQMAQFFKDNLKPNLKIYLEYSNEIWNGIYKANKWVGDNGPSNLNHPQKTAYFTKQAFAIWSNVFGSEMSQRVVRIAACQLANPWIGQQIMQYLGNGGADAVSPAAYYILRAEDYNALEALGSNATVADVAKMIRGWFPTLKSLLEQHNQLAKQYNTRLLFYEGGGEIKPRNASNPSAQAIYAFQKDTAVYNVSQEWFRLITSVTNADLFVYFHLASRTDSQNEGYGALESIFGEPTPKYKAMLDFGKQTTSVNNDDKSFPSKIQLLQNYPNPFNPETTINYQIPFASYVTLKVYDVLGNEVASLVDEYKQAGSYNCKLRIENGEFASGIYFYRMQTSNGFGETKKLLLMK